MESKNSNQQDVEARHKELEQVRTDRKGFYGVFELLLRKFKDLMHIVLMLPLYGIGSVCLGLAVTPGIMFFTWAFKLSAQWEPYFRYPWLGICLAASYFIYGFSLILLIPWLNKVAVGRLKPWRGPYYSAATFRWYLHNGFTYLVRYTFLEFATPSPANVYFFRQMGMKIGRGVQINTSHISDPSLIEIGNKVTIGGSATIVAHYGAGGYLVIAPTIIEDRATLGLRATVMGGVRIGAGAKVLPNSVVMPNTEIPPGEIWGGVPAVRIDRKALKQNRGQKPA